MTVSLRTRLLLVLLAIASVGLIVADIVTYVELRHSLLARVDQQLDGISLPAAQHLERDALLGHRTSDLLNAITRDEAYLEVLVPGRVPALSNYYYAKTTAFQPLLPAVLRPPAHKPFDPGNSDPSDYDHLTVRSTHRAGPQWRVGVTSNARGETIIIAITLADVTDTLDRLRYIEVAITGLVLAAGTVVGFWLVNLGLRPLRQIERTARAISGGDLSRRVRLTSPKTEVGRLGLTFNSMLGEIETSFAARSASEEKLRRFVADASHELRSPLTSIRGYAELFNKVSGREPQVASRAVSRIEQEADRMSALVDDLLLIARMDEGQALADEPVDLAGVVLDSTEAARATEPDRAIKLELVALPVLVRGDHRRLRQVVDNLLANVRSHTPVEAGASVTVSTSGEGDHRFARVVVSDEGSGLEAEQARRAFERFYRADPSRARTRGGSGLGLAIVASIVDAHHGRCGMESTPGSGTKVWFEIPLSPTAPPRTAPPPTASTSTPTLGARGGHRKAREDPVNSGPIGVEPVSAEASTGR